MKGTINNPLVPIICRSSLRDWLLASHVGKDLYRFWLLCAIFEVILCMYQLEFNHGPLFVLQKWLPLRNLLQKKCWRFQGLPQFGCQWPRAPRTRTTGNHLKSSTFKTTQSITKLLVQCKTISFAFSRQAEWWRRRLCLITSWQTNTPCFTFVNREVRIS